MVSWSRNKNISDKYGSREYIQRSKESTVISIALSPQRISWTFSLCPSYSVSTDIGVSVQFKCQYHRIVSNVGTSIHTVRASVFAVSISVSAISAISTSISPASSSVSTVSGSVSNLRPSVHTGNTSDFVVGTCVNKCQC